jgi:hypothetical protein
MRGHKLRSGVNWEGALGQKGIKQTGTTQGPGIMRSMLLLLLLLLPAITQYNSIEVMMQVVT